MYLFRKDAKLGSWLVYGRINSFISLFFYHM